MCESEHCRPRHSTDARHPQLHCSAMDTLREGHCCTCEEFWSICQLHSSGRSVNLKDCKPTTRCTRLAASCTAAALPYGHLSEQRFLLHTYFVNQAPASLSVNGTEPAQCLAMISLQTRSSCCMPLHAVHSTTSDQKIAANPDAVTRSPPWYWKELLIAGSSSRECTLSFLDCQSTLLASNRRLHHVTSSFVIGKKEEHTWRRIQIVDTRHGARTEWSTDGLAGRKATAVYKP